MYLLFSAVSKEEAVINPEVKRNIWSKEEKNVLIQFIADNPHESYNNYEAISKAVSNKLKIPGKTFKNIVSQVQYMEKKVLEVYARRIHGRGSTISGDNATYGFTRLYPVFCKNMILPTDLAADRPPSVPATKISVEQQQPNLQVEDLPLDCRIDQETIVEQVKSVPLLRKIQEPRAGPIARKQLEISTAQLRIAEADLEIKKKKLEWKRGKWQKEVALKEREIELKEMEMQKKYEFE